MIFFNKPDDWSGIRVQLPNQIGNDGPLAIQSGHVENGYGILYSDKERTKIAGYISFTDNIS